MGPQTATSPTETPQRIDQGWVVAMPKEIAELFGVPEGSLVTLLLQEEGLTALMNLALQTDEARKREPGWFLEMPPDMATAAGLPDKSFLALYAKEGALRVEVLPPPSPELEAAAARIWNEYQEVFEELKRLGD